ncbi:hypothetical protein TSOC_002462 [Tetrabaena socialis]|uniref:Fe2OG dioxygenase domain-containing protein n=1 Tax=Tetrabaena socialis TaxID=47790 RepID=A0A2J8AE04_9CHLO|nr:hypothetical protein TSOC_002462 [Tetrabaena socialis]|eukprot:PNH10747.1 hypothetical protein TSOC_002462 [Tetrabaena socialis]
MSTRKAKVARTDATGTPAPLKAQRLPKVSAKIHEVMPLYPETDPSIYSIPGVLSSDECQKLRDYLVAQHPLTHVAHAQTKGIAWRDVDRVEFSCPELGALLWGAGLGEALQEAVPLEAGQQWAGLNSKWRVYRYGEGQGFGPHFDEEDTDRLTRYKSHYTLLLYLSDVRQGGETVFYKSRGREVLSVTPEQGLVVVHAQGHACLLHEGRPVGRGCEKWVLRSDVMVRPEAG